MKSEHLNNDLPIGEHSDLIYLFIDNEASDLEKTMLFSALANDVDLQREFAEAIRINGAARQEQNEAFPPADVTDSLFRKAGFGPVPPIGMPAGPGVSIVTGEQIAEADGRASATDHSTPSSPPVIPVATRRQRSRRDEEREPVARRTLLPFFSAFAGTALAILLFLTSGGEFRGNGNGEVMADVRREAKSGVERSKENGMEGIDGRERNGMIAGRENGKANQEVSTLSATSSDQSLSTPLPTTSLNRSSPQHAAGLLNRSGKDNQSERMITAQNQKAGTASNIDSGQNATDRQGTDRDQVADPKPTDPEAIDLRPLSPEQAALASVHPIDFSREEMISSRLSTEDLRRHLEDLQEEKGSTSSNSSFSVAARGMADLDLMPARVGASAPSAYDNLALSVGYNFNPHHRLLVEGGRDYQPLYIDSAGSVILLDIASNGTWSGSAPGILTINGAGGSGGLGVGSFNESLKDSSLGNIRTSNGGNVGSVPLVIADDTTGQSTLTSSALTPVATWFGVGYRFTADPLDRQEAIRPYASTAIGYAPTIGPVGKVGAGLSWQPDSRVSFNLGMELTGQFFRYQQSWTSASKLAASYGVEVSF